MPHLPVCPAPARLLRTACWVTGIALLGLAAPAHAQTLELAIRQALRQYPSVTSALAAVESSKAEIDRAKGAYLPTLGFESSASQIQGTASPKPQAAPRLSWSVPINGRVAADVERAESAFRASQAQVAITQDEVALQVAEAWLAVVRGQQMVVLADKNLQEHESILQDVRRIVAIDTGRALDLSQARVRRDAAANALNQRRTELSQSREKLARYLSEKPADSAFEAYPVFAPQLPSSLAQGLAEAASPAVAQARAQVEEAQARADAARRLAYPSLDLSVARQRLTTLGDPTTVTTASLNMPLYEGGRTDALLRSSLALTEAARARLAETELVAAERIRQAYVDLGAAQDRLSLAALQRDSGLQLVRGFRAQFTMARRTLLDLLNIQNEYAGYQQAEAQAQHDVQLAQYRISATLGQLAKTFVAR